MNANIADSDPLLLTKQQLAEKLGVNPRSVEVWMAQRKIPALKISGKCVRFKLQSVLRALERFEVKAVGEK